MQTESGCLICKEDLVYNHISEKMTCTICGREFDSNAKCVNGHFICDSCHESDAVDFIESFCQNTDNTDPLLSAVQIMNNPKIKMHGPEHHFLVPAVLISAYYNKLDRHSEIKEKLAVAKERSKNILGGFCGLYGACGAGIGTGMFVSVVLQATPLSKEEWKLANLLTSKCLEKIAMKGGPRCCKRDTFIALETAVGFIRENMDVDLPSEKVRCTFSGNNRECLGKICVYHKNHEG